MHTLRKRLLFGLTAAVLATVLGMGGWIYFGSAHAAEKDAAYPSLELFSWVLEKVRKDYVDGKNLTYQELVYGALKGMINTLDPHSEFMEPANYDELQKDTQGAFGGLGIMIEPKGDFVTVLAPMEDSPGAKAGILAGDRIIKIDGRSAGKDLKEAVQRLRGEPGTEVTLTIQRPATGEIKDLKLTRATIKVDMVKDINNRREFPVGADKIGYLRLVQFGEKTSEDLEKALVKLKAQGMQALILDLRWNPGGLLDQAVEVCQKFLPPGTLVVSTEGRNPAQNSVRYARGRGDELNGMPIVILVNSFSASASEIVSGCLQDLKRAQIMGEKTFGKGSVQSILPWQDGSALKLTTAKYYTPSHKVIHGEGITPDCIVPMSDEEYEAVNLRQRRPNLDSLEEKDLRILERLNDPQMDRARDLLHGILIYTHRTSPPQKFAAREDKQAAAAH